MEEEGVEKVSGQTAEAVRGGLDESSRIKGGERGETKAREMEEGGTESDGAEVGKVRRVEGEIEEKRIEEGNGGAFSMCEGSKPPVVTWLLSSRRNQIIFGVILIAGLLLSALIVGLAVGVSPRGRIPIADLLRRAPLIDGHNLLPRRLYEIANNQLEGVDLRDNSRTHTDLRRLRQATVKALFMSVSVDCAAQYRDAVRACLDQIDLVRRLVNKYEDDLVLVDSYDELMAGIDDDKISVVMALEAGHCIDSSLAVLRIFYELGVRYMTITQNCHTPWAESWIVDTNQSPPNGVASSAVTSKRGGLTEFGESVIREMNRLGMIVDLSHAALETARQSLILSSAPVIFSHSAVFSLCPHFRNVPDDLLILLKRNRGLLLMSFYNDFITCTQIANVTHVANHFDYVKDLIGVDYLGIGADFDGIKRTPDGLKDVSMYENLFQVLRDRGWKDDELEKVAGKNILRVFREVEKVSRRQQSKSDRPNEVLIPPADLVNTTCRITMQ